MPVLDADALNTDPQGLEFLRDVLGTGAELALPERRFPLDAWTPKAPVLGLADSASLPAVAPTPEQIAPQFADVAA